MTGQSGTHGGIAARRLVAKQGSSYNRTGGNRRGREKVSRAMTPGSFARSVRSLVTKTKCSAIPLPRSFSTMPTVRPPSNQNGVEKGGPIRVSSRLKEGRALVPDVWSIYKSVLAMRAPFSIFLVLTVSFSLQCCKSPSGLH